MTTARGLAALSNERRPHENRTIGVRQKRMYWDVIEVLPRPDYCLFVRFKNGLQGLVQLRREQLTGALEPLRDERFFEQVFIDGGAVAWPGEIDLAPDAMYAEVSRKQKQAELSVRRQ
jgi:hypothetical protein